VSDPAAGFDPHAQRYAEELAQGLMLSGESSDYFLRRRLQRTAELLGQQPQAVLDFGCGVGAATPVLRELFPAARLYGVDISGASLDFARQQHGALAQFQQPQSMLPQSVDLAYCNGVFHHIPPDQRALAMAQIAAALRPGGVLAFWDNNPWSLPARWVMSRIPFDHDAVMVWPKQARALIVNAGLNILHNEFHFIWPRSLASLRPTERWLRRAPLGAQYLVFSRVRK
jgi:SAM-dependent methyltransferase